MNLHHDEGVRGQAVVIFGAHVEDAADADEVLDAFQGVRILAWSLPPLARACVQHALGVIGVAAEAGLRGLELGLVFFGIFLTHGLLGVGIGELL